MKNPLARRITAVTALVMITCVIAQAQEDAAQSHSPDEDLSSDAPDNAEFEQLSRGPARCTFLGRFIQEYAASPHRTVVEERFERCKKGTTTEPSLISYSELGWTPMTGAELQKRRSADFAPFRTQGRVGPGKVLAHGLWILRTDEPVVGGKDGFSVKEVKAPAIPLRRFPVEGVEDDFSIGRVILRPIGTLGGGRIILLTRDVQRLAFGGVVELESDERGIYVFDQAHFVLPVGAHLEISGVLWDDYELITGTAVLTENGLELQAGANIYEGLL